MSFTFFSILGVAEIKCTACNRYCVIKENQTGFCKVRKNINGSLVSLVDNKPIAIAIDPIEKKPLYHFLPKTKTLSFGTVGCNFDCAFCQNFSISNPKEFNLDLLPMVSEQQIIDLALKNNLPSISYTYNEPTVFSEFALRVMKLAKKNNLKNIWVSNGYMSKEVLKELTKYLDAINIDLKGDQAFYDNLIPGINVDIIKENIKYLHKKGVHVEITNLLLEGYNTKKEQIQEIIDFVSSISSDIPLHFSRSFPCYRLKDITPTKIESLKLAKDLAISSRLKNIYLGNI
jgi:pyruvate formate lyase activating enzyme